MKQSQMNFEEIRLALLLFLQLLPKHASHSQAQPKLLFNPEKDRENRKKAWFIRLRWDCWMEQKQKRLGDRDRRRGHWIGKLKVEYRRECCRIAAMKRERGLVFSRPGRSIFGWTRGWFLVGREQFLFSSHPDPSKCPSEKEHKKYEAESDEFQRNSSGPASFFVSVTQARIPVPIPPKLLLQSRKQPGK